MKCLKLFSYRCLLVVASLLCEWPMMAQQSEIYSYRQYLKDQKLEGEILSAFKIEKYDSVQAKLMRYRNRLGYNYYRMMAALLKVENDPYYKLYLDTAFSRGMETPCIGTLKKYFDETELNERKQKNYLHAYDRALAITIDSMCRLDQQYRKHILDLRGPSKFKQFAKTNDSLAPAQKLEEKIRIDKKVDSLMALQDPIDKSNQALLFKIINRDGWPSTKKIGRNYCTRMAPDPWMIVVHIKDPAENKKVQMQLATLLTELCEKNEQDWVIVETMIWSIHTRYRKEFSELSFIKIKNGKLDTTASFISLKQMAEAVVKNSTEQMEIKCKDKAVFEQIITELKKLGAQVEMGYLNHLYKSEGWPMPHAPLDADFVFVPDDSMAPDKVEFRFVVLREPPVK